MNGRQVERARAILGNISQDELALLIGTSQSTVSRWEAKPDERIPRQCAKKIQLLVNQARQGLALIGTGLPENAIEYPPPVDAPPGSPRVLLVYPKPVRTPKKQEKPPAPPEGTPSSTAQGQPPPADAPAKASGGWQRSLLGIAAMAGLAGCFIREVPPHQCPPCPPSCQSQANAPGQVSEQLPTRMPPPVTPVITTSSVTGLKMPEKPEPTWLTPGPDGKCRNPQTGEQIRAVVFRGTCYDLFAVVERAKDGTCPDWAFDPPPEVMKDPVLRHDYGSSCYRPIQLKQPPKAAKP